MSSSIADAEVDAMGGRGHLRLPHREIETLVERLADGVPALSAESARLVRLVVREVENLRAVTHQLVNERIASANAQAAQIVAQATAQAASIRASALASRSTDIPVEPTSV